MSVKACKCVYFSSDGEYLPMADSLAYNKWDDDGKLRRCILCKGYVPFGAAKLNAYVKMELRAAELVAIGHPAFLAQMTGHEHCGWIAWANNNESYGNEADVLRTLPGWLAREIIHSLNVVNVRLDAAKAVADNEHLSIKCRNLESKLAEVEKARDEARYACKATEADLEDMTRLRNELQHEVDDIRDVSKINSRLFIAEAKLEKVSRYLDGPQKPCSDGCSARGDNCRACAVYDLREIVGDHE